MVGFKVPIVLGFTLPPSLTQNKPHTSHHTPHTTHGKVTFLFSVCFETYANQPCLGFETAPGAWVWKTYGAVLERVKSVAAALRRRQIRCGDYVGLCAENSVAYVEVMLGLLYAGCVVVPLALVFSKEQLGHILEETNMAAVFTSTTPGLLKDKLDRAVEEHCGAQ